MARTTTGRPSRQQTRRPSRQTAARGRFARAGQPTRRRIPQRSRQQQRSGGREGAFGQLTRFAPLLGKLTGGPGRCRGGRGGGLPVNAKMLTGLLGAGAAGTALVRKRRARRGRADAEVSSPPH